MSYTPYNDADASLLLMPLYCIIIIAPIHVDSYLAFYLQRLRFFAMNSRHIFIITICRLRAKAHRDHAKNEKPAS